MGYTHYFTQLRSATQQEWDAISQDFSKVLGLLDPAIEIVGPGGEKGTAPLVDRDRIAFNGAGEQCHETMSIKRELTGEQDFNFCKTAHRPYDVAVTALLAIMNHRSSAWEIRSDGKTRPEMWIPGLQLAAEAIGGKVSISFDDERTFSSDDVVPKRKYLVTVHRHVTQSLDVEVDAITIREAEERAMEIAGDLDFTGREKDAYYSVGVH